MNSHWLRRHLPEGAPARTPRLLLWLSGCAGDVGALRERIRGVDVEYDGRTFIGSTLFREGGFEEPEIEFCAGRLRALGAPVLLDIGANLGWHTLRWATLLPHATIHAFEPAPGSRARLQRNLERNDLLGRVRVHEAAVSSTTGHASFHLAADDAYGSLVPPDRSPVAGRVDVPVTTLDEFVWRQGLEHIDLVKIDVEGVEHEVLEGATRTLHAMKPDLLVEIYEGQRAAPKAADVVASLARLGYRAYVFQEGSAAPFTTHRDWYYNYFFTVGAAPAARAGT